jgi:hypothetical protein
MILRRILHSRPFPFCGIEKMYVCRGIGKSSLTIGFPEHFDDLEELVLLKRYILLRIKLCLFALKNGTKASQLSHNTAYSPAVDCFVVMFGSHKKLR